MRADSIEFAKEAAAAAAAQLPRPPFALSDRARKYWPMILNGKRLGSWTANDLVVAAHLAEDLAHLEKLRAATRKSLLSDDAKLADQIDKVHRRILATQRGLQIHALANAGATHRQGLKNNAARQIAADLDDTEDEELFG